MKEIRVYLTKLRLNPEKVEKPKKEVSLFTLNSVLIHYANMSVQYTAIFHGYKNDYFQMKICDVFLIFAQNIDCGYSLEPPQ